MSASYDFFPTPQPKGSNKVRYHARLVVNRHVSTETIIKQIASRCSLKEGDLAGALIELVKSIKSELMEGNTVQVKGLGSFRISAKSPAVRTPNEIRAESIKFGGIVYTPDKELQHALKVTRFKRVAETHRSQTWSEIEIDGLLADYFKDHSYITTRSMCALCGLRKATALRRLQARVAEGRLTHPGYKRAPFYYPAPGHFRVSQEKGSSVQQAGIEGDRREGEKI